MKFTPLTEEELAKQRGTLEPGECDFEIVKAEETVSKSGNPMLKAELRVWDKNGREGYVFDYLLADHQWKLKSLCVAIGKPKLYDSGSIDQGHLIGQAGKVLIKIQEDKTGKYAPRPVVKYYIEPGDKPKVADTKADLPNFNEESDVPF